jgi:hypothetical protein
MVTRRQPPVRPPQRSETSVVPRRQAPRAQRPLPEEQRELRLRRQHWPVRPEQFLQERPRTGAERSGRAEQHLR